MKPNRITLHIPSGLRVVIPEVVVVQAALGVVVLPREAQVHHGVVWATGLAVAEGVGLPLPGQARPGQALVIVWPLKAMRRLPSLA